MKIYHIRDTRNFFDTLNRSEGDVEFVDGKNHTVWLIKNGKNDLSAAAALFSNGSIDEIELHFGKQADSVRMMEYLIAM